MARARVAPLKPMSIPRLELQAALMGSRMVHAVKSEHSISFEKVFLWTDSRTVLSWIRSDVGRFKQFVAHRLGEIDELTNASDWRWIPTDDNVADDATRDSKECTFVGNERWWNGPEFLRLVEEEWPIEPTESDKHEYDDELRSQVVAVHTRKNDDDDLIKFTRFSSWNRLVRAMAWVLRFVKIVRLRVRKSNKVLMPFLQPKEIIKAERVLITCSQKKSFGHDMTLLAKNEQLPRSSKLSRLSPGLDNFGVLRIQGRLAVDRKLPMDTRCPIILDSAHYYTILLIQHYHRKNHHQGNETVANEIRQRFWVIGLRSKVRRVQHECKWCSLKKSKPVVPMMGLLPPVRYQQRVKPFTFTGVDYFGPIEVNCHGQGQKMYGALFTCLTVRAVHLELVKAMSSNSCILAIRRLIATRGPINVMYSDNGSYFVGADNEIQKMANVYNKTTMGKLSASLGITWRFIPPGTPHMGGAWERLVRSVKTCLMSAIRPGAFEEDTVRTIFSEITYVVNNRPLTHVSVDANDPESITPNHFLHGGPSTDVGFGGACDLKHEWKRAQRTVNKFWRRWVKEYLPTLTRRYKWDKDTKPIKVGDIVVIADPTLPRNTWPLGRVVTIHPGPDDKVRVVDVKTVHGVYRRSTSSLCVLDVLHKDDKKTSVIGEENVTENKDSD